MSKQHIKVLDAEPESTFIFFFINLFRIPLLVKVGVLFYHALTSSFTPKPKLLK